MAFSLVAHTITVGGANGGTTSAINTTGADLLVVFVTNNNFGVSPTISDSKSNTWTGLTLKGGGDGFTESRLWYSRTTTVGSGHTFTVSGSGIYANLSVAAFSGSHTSPFVNESAAATLSSVTSLSPGGVSPSSTDNLFIVGYKADNNADFASAFAVNSSFSVLDATPNIAFTTYDSGLAYKIKTDGTSENPTGSWTTASSAIAVLACFKVAAGPAVPQTYYVSASSGSDSNPGTFASPLSTFNHAINSVMVPGDTLFARGGNYVENVVITTSGTDWTTGSGAITVKNYPSEVPYIKPAAGICALAWQNGSACAYHIWTGINVDGINLTGPADPAIYIGHDAHHIRFQNAAVKNAYWTAIGMFQGPNIEILSNTITDGGRVGTTGGADASHGIYISGFSGASVGVDSHILIDGNVIHGFTTHSLNSGIQIYTGASDTDKVGGVTIRNNHVYNNSYGSFLGDVQTVPILVYNNIYEGNVSSGIVLYSRLHGAKIYNNTIHGNGDRGIDIGSGGDVLSSLIKNNAITSNLGAPITIWNTDPTQSATIQFNAFNGNGHSNTVDDQNSLSTISSNITTAANYTNSGAQDFTLLSTSTFIDAGTSLAGTVDIDYIGTSRPQHSTFDIGAFEFLNPSVSRPFLKLRPRFVFRRF